MIQHVGCGGNGTPADDHTIVPRCLNEVRAEAWNRAAQARGTRPGRWPQPRQPGRTRPDS
jgi:hypothetical protein